MVLSSLVIVAALLVAQALLGLSHSGPTAQAAGGGGSGSCADIPEGVCHFKGNTAEANFTLTSADGCIQTTFHLTVSENVTVTPPDPRVSGEAAFAFLTEYDNCVANDYVSVLSGFVSEVNFRAARVATASLDATIDAEDGSGIPVPMTIHLTWQGVGDGSITRQDSYLKSSAILMISKYQAVSRDAVITGSIAFGTTVFASSTGGEDGVNFTGDLFYVQEGSLQISRS